LVLDFIVEIKHPVSFSAHLGLNPNRLKARETKVHKGASTYDPVPSRTSVDCGWLKSETVPHRCDWEIQTSQEAELFQNKSKWECIES
jgi:hypothetical protein